ncbi:MAG: glycosyltransferase [Prevotellaceae bacterium]|jgi:glycosyltransferase involved in cell wall biosynthesis|nr:glycosyltransferase [Prevotellaceae bacterium]
MIFSIITVTFNAGKVLEQTILSVVNQTCPHIEYIIVDGNSSDNTKEIIKKYEPAISHWISEPDAGLYDAMNKGLHIATGDYVWFLNAGDVIQNGNIAAELANIAEKHQMPDILYGDTNLIDSNGNIIAERRLKTPKALTWKSFRMGMLVCHQAFIVRRKIAEEYDLRYRFSADFEWCIRCMKSAKTIINTHLLLINYLYEGLTTANRKVSLKERHAIMCKYYGVVITDILHIWFAVRYYWAKWTNGII